jgi:hypothetical protein
VAEERILDLTTGKTTVDTEDGAGVIRKAGAAGEVKEKVEAVAEVMLQGKAKRLQRTDKSRIKPFPRFRRSFCRRMTKRTLTLKYASFAPRPLSTPPSLHATTDRATSAPFACARFTRQKPARIAEPNPITLF